MNQQPINLNYVVANAEAPSTPFVETFQTRNPTPNDINYPIQKRWFNTVLNQEYLLVGFTSMGGVLQAIWRSINSGGNVLQIAVPNGTTPIQPDVTGTITFTSNDSTVTITGSSASPNNNFIDFSAAVGASGIQHIITDTGAGTPLQGATINLNSTTPYATSTGPNSLRVTASSNTQGFIALQLAGSNAAASTPNNFGIAQFDANQFNVIGGFVQIKGGTTQPTLGLTPDAFTAPGTNPVVPNGSGNIRIEGGALFNTGTQANPIRTNSLAANTLDLQIQRAGSNASIAAANNFGVAQFDANQFTVTAGFVQLAGGTTPAIEKVGVDTGAFNPVLPTASQINILGSLVAAGTNPIRTDGTASNTVTIEVQKTQAIAATDSTKVGLANFDSAAFDVDANGFVQLNGGGIAATSFDVQAATAPGVDPVLPTAAGVVAVNGAVVANHSVVLETRSRALNAYNIEVQQATQAAAPDATKSGVSHFNSAQFTVDGSGFVQLAAGVASVLTLSDDVGTKTGPDVTGNIQLPGHVINQTGNFSTTVKGTNLIRINPMSSARWIVDAKSLSGGIQFNGTHATITAALTAATSGDTIFIMPGTYTENLTLKAGVSLTAWSSDSSLDGTGNVKIVGNSTFSGAGTVTISGIQLQTNGAAFLTVSGVNASIVNLINCYLNCTNSTGISYTSSSPSSLVNIYQCTGDITTAGNALLTSSSPGTIQAFYSTFFNSGSSSTANSITNGRCAFWWCELTNPISSTSTSFLDIRNTLINASQTNSTCLVMNGTGGTHQIKYCTLRSNNATAATIGAGSSVVMVLCDITTTSGNALSGAGTINYAGLVFIANSGNVVVTRNLLPFT